VLHTDLGLRVAVLVNDFGAINIDSQLIVGVEGETISLANGCICCSIRGDLLQAVMRLRLHPQPPELIVIETSGVSDPAQVAATFAAPEARAHFRVDSIITVVDAEQGGARLEGEHYFLAMEQIGVADIAILNKVDLATPQALEEIRAWVREIAPRARLLETSHGQAPLPLLIGVGRFDPERLAQHPARERHVHEAGADTDHPHDHHAVFETWNWRSAEALAWPALQRAVDRLPLAIYRAKGIVYAAEFPERRVILQVVGQRVTLEMGQPWGEQTPGSQIVVIGAHGGVDAPALQRLFDDALAARQPGGALQRLTSDMRSWLRGRR
jgi:G3E family GTPase